MNTAAIPSIDQSDSELLVRCLHGERDAFGQLVSRYQGLVCAQAYAVCGDFGRSEDVAQEAFLSAWKQLRDLRDHAKFKAWICGIARHLALRSAARQERDAAVAVTIPNSDGSGATPHEEVVSREEETIVWSAMQELPEAYRTALTLFYREQQSVAKVAETLDLSEMAVKQRLSRGRAMLKEQVAGRVENALFRSRPGPAFTLGVLALAAAAAPESATAATLLAASAKTGATAKGALLFAPFVGLLGGLIGLFGGWFGMKSALEAAQYDREREALKRSGRRVWLAVALFVGIQLAAAVLVRKIWSDQRLGLRTFLSDHPASLPFFIFVLVAAYIGWMVWEIFRNKREIRQIRAEELAAGSPRREPSGVWRRLSFRGPLEYRSRACFLGWPLIHVLWPDPDAKAGPKRAARGWLALGDAPVGLIAAGGFARGGLAIGGCAIGLVAFGGVAIGPVAIGGLALAIWAYGGAAVGWLAQGGLAMGWRAAMGGCALAHDFALGGYSAAAQANDPAAEAFAEHSRWLQFTAEPWLACLVPVAVVAVLASMGLCAAKIRRRQAQEETVTIAP